MTRTRLFLILVVTTGLLTASLNASAAAIRVDAGDWDSTGFISGSAAASVGFSFDFQGVTTSSVTISSDGRVDLSGGGETAAMLPFFDPNQSGGGNTAQFQYATTNANFTQAGVDAGFRVSWQVFNAAGSLLNEFQLALFDLSDGRLAMEFNYNRILFGDDSSSAGYTSSAGDSLDLFGALGLSFLEYMGIGDDSFSNNCAPGTDALACNNYFGNTGDFGPGLAVLPDMLGGFFRVVDTNGDPTQGRYLWVFGDAQTMPEPGTLLLIALGGMAFVARRRR